MLARIIILLQFEMKMSTFLAVDWFDECQWCAVGYILLWNFVKIVDEGVCLFTVHYLCKRYERSTNKEQERESVDYYVMLLVLDGECHGVSNLVQDFAQVLRSMGRA